MQISQKIKQIRLERNLTQKELSQLCGVRQAAISVFENKGNISISNLEKIMKFFKLEIK